MATYTIFIPAYNAERTIASVVERIPDALWPAIVAVIVVEDGSTDDTGGVVERLSARFPGPTGPSPNQSGVRRCGPNRPSLELGDRRGLCSLSPR